MNLNFDKVTLEDALYIAANLRLSDREECNAHTDTKAQTTLLNLADTAQQASAAQDAINADANNQAKAIEEQQAQISKNATDQMQERSQQAAIERGRLRAIQAESGLIGNTQDRIIGESYFNEATDIASIEANRKNSIEQSNRQLQGVTTSAQSKLNSIKQPSLLGAGLQIGTTYATYKQRTTK